MVKSFFHLHQQATPLLLCNVWNAESATIAERIGFQAIGTSSAAIAHSLGYEDGEALSFEDLLFVVRKIRQAITLPLTVDIEAGYSDKPEQIARNITTLQNLGVAGINIEDSKVENDQRIMLSPELFAQRLEETLAILSSQNIGIFINLRTDAYVTGNADALNETLTRIALYQQLNIHGLFVPAVEKSEDIRALVAATDLPINVMAMPDLPAITALTKLGVKRISMGNWLHAKVNQKLEALASSVINKQELSILFD